MDCLEWEHVWARYERAWAVRDASLGVAAGGTLYLVGPSGGGKTTLLRVAGGDLHAEAGRVWVDGRPLRRQRPAVLGSAEALHSGLTVERNVHRRLSRAGVKGRHLERSLKTALRTWDLDAWRETRARALPASLAQRAFLAMQWACPARVWLLDNPTALLEPEWREAWPALVNAWRAREGGAVAIATNQPEEAMAGDRVAILHAGRVAAFGPPEKLCRTSGAEEIIVRTMDDAASALVLASNLRIEAERRPDGLRLRVRHAEETLPGVLQTLGGSVETVWVRRPTMQDAITHHASLPTPSDAPTQPTRG